MFRDNKYTNWYYAIIASAQKSPPTGYSETHHIVPKCLNGDDGKSNRVKLSARQHFVCHWLLTKMVYEEHYVKMQHALWHMMQDKRNARPRYRPSSRVYELLRQSFSESRRGIQFTEEHKQKLREAAKGRSRSSYVRIATPESRARMSEAAKNRTTSGKGRKFSESHKAALSAAKTRWWADKKVNTQ